MAGGLLIAATGVWLVMGPGTTRVTQPPPRTIPLTSYTGGESDPAISPDGTQVAFTRAGEPGGVRDLYVKLIDGGEPVPISRGAVDAFGPTWSPDSNQIAFIRSPKGTDGELTRRIFIVSALGRAEREIAEFRAALGGGLSWSPGGKLLAIVHRESPDDPDALFLLSLETGERQRLTTPPRGWDGDFSPRFSPDGRTVAFVRRRIIIHSDIHLVGADGAGLRRLTSGNRLTSGLDWSPDGRGMVFGAQRPGRAGFYSLWRVAVSGGEPEPLEVGELGFKPTLSRMGERLAYEKGERRYDIWRVGGPASPSEGATPTSRFIHTPRRDVYPQYSPDGRMIAFTSDRSGFYEIWLCDSDGSNPRQLTFLEDPHTMQPRWSPAGDRVAFFSNKHGSSGIYVVGAMAGIPRRLTTDTAADMHPSWSNDERWVYFSSDRTGRLELHKVPAEGGSVLQVTTNGGVSALESPDGQFLYFTKSFLERGTLGIWRIPVGGGEEVQVHDRGESDMFAVMKQGICYLDRTSDPPAVEYLDLATGEVIQTAVLERQPSQFGFAVSPDRRWVLYSEREEESDIMLVEDFR